MKLWSQPRSPRTVPALCLGLVIVALPPAILRATQTETAPAASQAVTSFVRPSKTDPQIDTFDTAHTLYFNPTAKSRHQLLLFLPGTKGQTGNISLFCKTAADLGYHVVSLMYPDDLAATACWNDADPEAFTKFRLDLIEGGDKSPYIKINRANSIENRLVKLLLYLKEKRPKEEWGQFLSTMGEKKDAPAWDHIAVAGQSQGGGHAALIACRHKVARVLMFSSPKDWSRHFEKPASWYTPSETPPSRYFAFVHEQDRQGCSYPQQLEILKTMHLTALGEPKSVDREKPPFAHSRILITNYPGTTVTSLVAHSAEVTDGGTPLEADGTPKFKPVWIYMLTAD